MMSVQFNSQAWYERQQLMYPFMLNLSFEACGQPFRQFFGIPFATSVLHYREDEQNVLASWLLRLEDAKTCGRLLTEALGVQSFSRYFQDAYADASTRLQMAMQAQGADAGGNLNDVIGQLRDFVAAYVRFYRLGAAAEPIRWWVEDAPPRGLTASAISVASTCGGSLVERRESTARQALVHLERLGCELAVTSGCNQADVMWFSPTEMAEPGFDFLVLAEEAAVRRQALVHTLSAYPLEEAEMAAMLSLARERCSEGLPSSAGIAVYTGREADSALRRIDIQLDLLAGDLRPLRFAAR